MAWVHHCTNHRIRTQTGRMNVRAFVLRGPRTNIRHYGRLRITIVKYVDGTVKSSRHKDIIGRIESASGVMAELYEKGHLIKIKRTTLRRGAGAPFIIERV